MIFTELSEGATYYIYNIIHKLYYTEKPMKKALYEDVGMAMPKTIETRCKYGSLQARQG